MSKPLGYVWWPAYKEDVSDLANARLAPSHLLGMGVLTFIMCLPSVTRATGVDAATILVLIGGHITWYLAGVYVLARRQPSRLRSNVLIAGNLFVNTGIAVAIPMATRDASTPLWMLPVVYACLNGAMQERERCITFLLAHALSPLAALALVDGGHSTWSVAAPIVSAAFCGIGYDRLATASAQWRQQRAEQEAELAELRARIASRDRVRLMQDLDQSVGSTLSVVGMYADLIDERIDNRDELRALAVMVRETARDGLGDLRGMLGAMAPAANDLAGLADTLRQAGKRAMEGSAIDLEVSVVDEMKQPVDGPLRVTLFRAFQDAVRAARRRDARRIRVRVEASGAVITLEVADDASGVVSDARMAERVVELGGTYACAAADVDGSSVRISLPRA